MVFFWHFLLGSAKVGKTAIVRRFLHNDYYETYTPTIEDFHRKIYKIRGEMYQLDMLDSSGIHPFPAMRRLSFLTGTLSVNRLYANSQNTFHRWRRQRKCDS